MTEISASRDALELASLQLTTTYYSATVVAVVLAIGLVRAHPRPRAGAVSLCSSRSRRGRTVSTLSNPALRASGRRAARARPRRPVPSARPQRRRILPLLGAARSAATASASSLVFRSRHGSRTPAPGYAQPEHWHGVASAYYGDLLGERLVSPARARRALLTLALCVLAVAAAIRAAHRRRRAPGRDRRRGSLPLLVVVGADRARHPCGALPAARRLRPGARSRRVAHGRCALPARAAPPVGRRRRRAPARGRRSQHPAARRCRAGARSPTSPASTDWVDASGRTGAGQFWTVRLPKLHLDDPSQLVQVDHRLNALRLAGEPPRLSTSARSRSSSRTRRRCHGSSRSRPSPRRSSTAVATASSTSATRRCRSGPPHS